MLASGSLVIGRVASQQCFAHCRSSLPLSIRRVALLYSFSTSIARHYATDQPVSRPKAHTGRVTSKRKPKSSTKSTGAAASKSASKARPKTTEKAQPRAKPKSKVKAKKKTKSKAKPKTRARKPLTDRQKTAAAAKKSRKEINDLRDKLLKPPLRLPTTAYQVLLVEHTKGTKGLAGGIGGVAKQTSAEYKGLSTEQREVGLFSDS